MPADEPPRRRHRLLIDVGADTVPDLLAALEGVLDAAREKGDGASSMSVVHGGPSTGWSALGEFRPEVTHETYFAAVEEWKARRLERSVAAALGSPKPHG